MLSHLSMGERMTRSRLHNHQEERTDVPQAPEQGTPPPSPSDSCGTCRFRGHAAPVGHTSVTGIECRRYPPTVIPMAGPTSNRAYPPVDPDNDYCGEYQNGPMRSSNGRSSR